MTSNERIGPKPNGSWLKRRGSGPARTVRLDAKIAGDTYFQIEMAIDSTFQSGYSKVVADVKATTRQHGGQGEALTYIQKKGWELVHAGFVFKESGQISRDKFLSSGQQVCRSGHGQIGSDRVKD